jgi:hypothetical protein
MKWRNQIGMTVSVLTLTILACTCTGILPGNLAGIRGSGNVVTQEEAITGFDQLDVSDGFTVAVGQGDSFSVVIRVDDNLLEHVQVAKQGSTLQIGLIPGRFIQGGTLEAEVTMPELTGLDGSGGSHVTLSDFASGNTLEVDLSGGSHLGGHIEAGDATFDISGGSHATLSGAAMDLRVDASGGSHARLGDMTVANADVDASGGSHVTVNASGELNAVANGGAQVRYLGNPTLGAIETEGSSSIEAE